MSELAFLDILHDRVKLLKLFWLAFWVSLVFLGIGYALILMDLIG